MDPSEFFVFAASGTLALYGILINRTGGLHALYFRDNPGPGLARLSVGLAVAWIGYVLWRHADPSVRGIYVWFYLVMGYAAVKIFGQSVAQVFGARVRVDAGERRNLAAAVLSAALTLATGLIFGGSLWGEADPTGEGEGGWWIPVTFFLLGWGVLVGAFKLFLAREAGDLKPLIRQERDLADARAAGVFLLSCSVVLTDAVAGDFWGWAHGLLTFGVLAGMLLVREMFARRSGGDQPQDQSEGRRVLESGVYVLLSGGAWLLNRMLDAALGPG